MKKIFIRCKKGETTADYQKCERIDTFRKSVLRFMCSQKNGNKSVFIDTNNGLRLFTQKELKDTMDSLGVGSLVEETNKEERKWMGVSIPFKKSRTSEEKRYIAVMSLNDDTDSDRLYDSLLRYLDYALFDAGDMPISETIAHLRRAPENFLFNKDILEFTFYDSIFIKRMRIDEENRGLVDLMESPVQ